MVICVWMFYINEWCNVLYMENKIAEHDGLYIDQKDGNKTVNSVNVKN